MNCRVFLVRIYSFDYEIAEQYKAEVPPWENAYSGSMIPPSVH